MAFPEPVTGLPDLGEHRVTALFLAALIVAVFIGVRVFAQDDCEAFDVAAAQRMIASKSVRELDSAFVHARRRDLPLTALYRSIRLDLNRSAAEELRYLRGLPKSREELFCVYRLTSPRKIGETDVVSRAIYEMFDRAAALTQKHKRGYKDVLRLALWADGELGEVAWDWYDAALEHDRARLVSGIKELSADEQTQLCGREIGSLAEKDLIAQCSPDL